jgi:hypothetical protein
MAPGRRAPAVPLMDRFSEGGLRSSERGGGAGVPCTVRFAEVVTKNSTAPSELEARTVAVSYEMPGERLVPRKNVLACPLASVVETV